MDMLNPDSAPKDLYNTEQNRTLFSIAAFFLLQRFIPSSSFSYYPGRGISTGLTFHRADGSVGER